MHILIGIVIVWVIYYFLMRGVDPPEKLSTEEELKKEGLSKLEIRREMRAQRQEIRSYSHLKNQSSRTSASLAKSLKSLAKKKKWYEK